MWRWVIEHSYLKSVSHWGQTSSLRCTWNSYRLEGLCISMLHECPCPSTCTLCGRGIQHRQISSWDVTILGRFTSLPSIAMLQLLQELCCTGVYDCHRLSIDEGMMLKLVNFEIHHHVCDHRRQRGVQLWGMLGPMTSLNVLNPVPQRALFVVRARRYRGRLSSS